MNVRILSELLAVSAALVFTSAQAAAGEPKTPEWYEVVTGVIAIPAALIGLAYSYLLIKKTRLEARKTELDSRKTELEILEKERHLAQFGGVSRTVLSETAIAAPSRGNRLMLLLLLRFVVLYLILSAWQVIEDVFSSLLGGVYISAREIFGRSFSWSDWFIPIVMVAHLPKIAYWLVFFSLAWPLFKDTNSALGIDIKNLLKVSTFRELRGKSKPKKG